MLGRIHSIDTFSTLDGPGIRTVIFMQGCYLRCKYCHNPDTWSLNNQIAREYTPEQLMNRIIRNRPYFNASGGGVTFSGGEPLLQHEFVQDIFMRCHRENISTAFDSSLYVSTGILNSILPYTDLILADIKSMQPSKSRHLVGASNEHNIENIELANRSKTPLWIRYVVVPSWTDEPEELQSMAQFAGSLEYVQRIDLLPYHSLGVHKWRLLGLQYELQNIKPPSYQQMETLKKLVETASHKPVVIHD